MDAYTRQEIDAMKSSLKAVEGVAYEALNNGVRHEAVCAERYKGIIDRLDRPWRMATRFIIALGGLYSILQIIDYIKVH